MVMLSVANILFRGHTPAPASPPRSSASCEALFRGGKHARDVGCAALLALSASHGRRTCWMRLAHTVDGGLKRAPEPLGRVSPILRPPRMRRWLRRLHEGWLAYGLPDCATLPTYAVEVQPKRANQNIGGKPTTWGFIRESWGFEHQELSRRARQVKLSGLHFEATVIRPSNCGFTVHSVLLSNPRLLISFISTVMRCAVLHAGQ